MTDLRGQAPDRVARSFGRADDELRPLSFDLDFVPQAAGSVLVRQGATMILCAASVVEDVPDWMKRGDRPADRGWLTSEYAMLPGSTTERKARAGARPDGRGVEIQRLIGRCLRGAIDLRLLGARTVYLDCDVLQADGGTRAAAITGAWVALAAAIRRLRERGVIDADPLVQPVAAVSVGLVDGRALLDLDYREDSRAEVDMNVAMTFDGRFVEVQGAGERAGFTKSQLDALLDMAQRGNARLFELQSACLAAPPARNPSPREHVQGTD